MRSWMLSTPENGTGGRTQSLFTRAIDTSPENSPLVWSWKCDAALAQFLAGARCHENLPDPLDQAVVRIDQRQRSRRQQAERFRHIENAQHVEKRRPIAMR